MSRGGVGEVPQSGWRIEKRYAPGVLIGNWSEERKKYIKCEAPRSTTYRTDFLRVPGHKPDVFTRRSAQLHNEGLGKQFLFYHNGNAYANNMISWYDEYYNKREREPWDRLPDLRTWKSKTLAWLPERSDHPMRGSSTNFGLYEKKLGQARNARSNTNTNPDYGTTYTSSYVPHPPGAFKLSRFATHRDYPTEVKSATPLACNGPPTPMDAQQPADQPLVSVAC